MNPIRKARLWLRRCSTCHQRMTSPPCSTSPGDRIGSHTVAGNGGRPCVDAS